MKIGWKVRFFDWQEILPLVHKNMKFLFIILFSFHYYFFDQAMNKTNNWVIKDLLIQFPILNNKKCKYSLLHSNYWNTLSQKWLVFKVIISSVAVQIPFLLLSYRKTENTFNTQQIPWSIDIRAFMTDIYSKLIFSMIRFHTLGM